jgi:RNA polymerase sigma factor (sigma-70 family)
MNPYDIFDEYQHLAKVTILRMFPDPKGICRQHRIEMSDLQQYALEGLWKGCLSFNPNKAQIKTHLINNVRWFVSMKLKREVSLIKYDSNKYNSIDKFGLVSMDGELNQNSDNEFSSYHDVIPSDINVEIDALSDIEQNYILSKLTDKQRKVVELKANGLNSGDISRMLNMTAANAREHLNKSKKRLTSYSEVM